MKYILKAIILFALIPVSIKSIAQIRWEVVGENVTLTPNIFIFKGAIGIYIGSFRDNVIKEGNGEITIDLNKKLVYLNDGNNIYQFKKDLIHSLKVDGYKYFNKDEIFDKNFSDSLILNHRKSLYSSLNLNKIEFSSSKRIQYEFSEQGFALKNQKKSIGKICYVSPTSITILYENGELDDFNDGDFNFLLVNSFKAFKCKTLYDFIYEDYINNLNSNIKRWEHDISGLGLDSVVSLFGPFDNILNVTSDRKMIVWKREEPVYYINLSTLNKAFTYSSGRSQANIYSSLYFNSSIRSPFYSISPIFLSGNSYRSTNSFFSESNIGISSSQSTQSGKIEKQDVGFSLTLMQDATNKTIKVVHKNIFSESNYGLSFRFIDF